MVIVVAAGATDEECTRIAETLVEAFAGSVPTLVSSWLGDVFCVESRAVSLAVRQRLSALPGVERLVSVSTPYQLASRAICPEKSVVRVGEARIGGPEPVMIAGPCSVETEEQMLRAARAARAAGAQVLRAGAYKPRTSPYAFQGLGEPGLALLRRAGDAVGLPVVTEVMEPGLVPTVAACADMLQIGTRNMQNYPLLRAVGRSDKPVLLKRGYAATIEEWLLAAEYILAEGNPHVVLCERGVRSFDSQTRNVLDLSCVPLLAQLTHLPVLVDPSHGTGRRDLVLPMGVAAIAAGADGVMVEMHPTPSTALSDAEQAIDPATLQQLGVQMRTVRAALRDVQTEERLHRETLQPAAQ